MTTEVRTVVILHGYEGNGPTHWQTWLADELPSLGVVVRYPRLPEPFAPDLVRGGTRSRSCSRPTSPPAASSSHTPSRAISGRTSPPTATAALADRAVLVAPPGRAESTRGVPAPASRAARGHDAGSGGSTYGRRARRRRPLAVQRHGLPDQRARRFATWPAGSTSMPTRGSVRGRSCATGSWAVDPVRAWQADRVPIPPEDPLNPDSHVPMTLRVSAAWSWRILVVTVAVAALIAAVARLQFVALALFVALLLSAFLAPLHERLVRWGAPRWLATAATLVSFVTVLVGVAILIGNSIANEWGTLSLAFQDGLADIRQWLADGPLHASDNQISEWIDSLQEALANNQDSLVSGALSTATTAAEVVSGAFLALFATIFFLHDGRGIGNWFVGLFPARSQDGVAAAGASGWLTLTGYVRGTVIIAFVDAASIGIVLTVLRVPLALPLAVLVFFGAFIPIVGAFVTGFVAVVVALAANGVWSAVAVLVAIIAVQQVEGHILQPVVMGRMVRLHPLAVVLAVTAGSLLAGIVGAVVAVPLVAVVNVVVRSYRSRSNAEHELASASAADPALDPLVDAEPVGAGEPSGRSVTRRRRPRPADRLVLSTQLVWSACQCRTMSRTLRTPTTSPASRTTRCRKPPRSIASAASVSVHVGAA